MSDAAITTIVTGTVTALGMIVGWLTLWLKLRYAGLKADDAATKAQAAVTRAEGMERKLDVNTGITESVNNKTDTIVKQTNGTMDQVRTIVEGIAERVTKLEEYNRTTAHRVLDSVNTLALKMERLLTLQDVKLPGPPVGKA